MDSILYKAKKKKKSFLANWLPESFLKQHDEETCVDFMTILKPILLPAQLTDTSGVCSDKQSHS